MCIRDSNIAILISKISPQWISVRCVQFWWHSVQKPQSSRRPYGKNRRIMPNISEYPRPILTWFIGLLGILVGKIFQVFVWRLSEGCCYGNQLNMGDVRKRRVEWPLLFASAFDNGLADRKSAFNGFNGNNKGTSRPHLVKFRQVISEFTLLKRAIFAAICPQFDDDLHSSRWRFQTDWKIAILISAVQSAIISVYPVEIWWDSVQWPRSLIHKKLYTRRQQFFWGDLKYVQ